MSRRNRTSRGISMPKTYPIFSLLPNNISWTQTQLKVFFCISCTYRNPKTTIWLINQRLSDSPIISMHNFLSLKIESRLGINRLRERVVLKIVIELMLSSPDILTSILIFQGRSRQSGWSGFNLTIFFEFYTNLTDRSGWSGWSSSV